jgi:hypothetical protein
MEARLKDLEDQLEFRKRIYHVVRILKVSSVEDQSGAVNALLTFDVDTLDRVASKMEARLERLKTNGFPGVF